MFTMNEKENDPINGKVPEFEAIFTEFQPRILRFVSNMAGETEAEDLTQEIFIKINQGLAQFRGECKLSTWVYRIAANAALDRMRSPAYQQKKSSISDQQIESEIVDHNIWTGEQVPVLEWQVVRKEMSECVQEYLQKLRTNYRIVLALSEIEGLSNQEIADILGITQGTVKIRLHRGREKLRNALIANCPSYWVEGNEYLPDLKNL
jgi:RNA polymerase sigma-70 factor (ECF subfamily)